jgi:anti-sigma B factor antagonist
MESDLSQPLIRFTEEGPVLIGTLTRRISSLEYEHFRRAIHEQIERDSPKAMVLDMEVVDRIDSTGIGLILSALRRMREANRELALANLNSECMDALRVTNLLSIVPIHGSVEEARRALSA